MAWYYNDTESGAGLRRGQASGDGEGRAMLDLEDTGVATATWHGVAQQPLIEEVHTGVAAFAERNGMAETTRRDLGIAVREAVSNAVVHAYPEGGAGDVEVDVAADAEYLTARVADRGAGATGRTAGLGVQLMRGMAEHLEIGPGSDGTGTVVVMEFRMTGRAAI